MHPERFENEVIPLQNGLYRFAKSLLHDSFEAEDVVQEVLTKLWSRWNSLNEIENIRAFAFKMTKNLCLDKIRLKKQLISEVEKEKLALPDFNPHELAEIEDMADVIQKIITFLPEQQRLIIQLRSVEELSFEEIEEITDMNINSIRVTLSRARKTVNEIYEKYFDS